MEKLPLKFHVAIEGNIEAGKSTLLQGLKKWFSKNNIRASVLPEPVKEWVWKGVELPITMPIRGSSGSARIWGHVKLLL